MIDKDWEEKLMQNTISHGTGLMRMSLNKNGGIDVDVVDPTDYRYWKKEPQISVNTEVLGYVEPQREWVGLNDDEIDYLIHLAYTGDEEFVQTIEAKLKEKNLPCIKPEWIGLTEKEHTEIAIECGCLSADWVFYGATVERKLKEKNNL
jgi:hypothetical protein